VQQHQSEQTEALRLLHVDFAQHAGEPNGFRAELPTDQRLPRCREVAFVKDQIDHRLHRSPPLGQGVVRRHLEGDARVVDLALRSHQPLRQGGFGHEKRARDFAGRQAAERAQSQRDLRLAIERRVAAGEYQPQPVVWKRGWRRHRVLIRRDRGLLLQKAAFFPPRAFAPRHIDQLAVSGGHDPRGGVLRDATVGPMRECGRERLLHRLFGAVERAGQPDQAGDDPPVLVTKHRFRARTDIGRAHREGSPMIGRISTQPAPPLHAVGILAAHAIASSRSLQSRM